MAIGEQSGKLWSGGLVHTGILLYYECLLLARMCSVGTGTPPVLCTLLGDQNTSVLTSWVNSPKSHMGALMLHACDHPFE